MSRTSTSSLRDTIPQTPTSKSALAIAEQFDASHPANELKRMHRLQLEMDAALKEAPPASSLALLSRDSHPRSPG